MIIHLQFIQNLLTLAISLNLLILRHFKTHSTLGFDHVLLVKEYLKPLANCVHQELTPFTTKVIIAINVLKIQLVKEEPR